MEIKRLTVKDCNFYQEMLEKYILECTNTGGTGVKFTPRDAKERCEELKRHLDKEEAIVFGAITSIGLTGFVWADKLPFREDVNRLYVQLLYVDFQYQNQQVEKMLLNAVEKEARRSNYTAVFLHTDASNEKALHFYHKMGYEDERVQMVRDLTNFNLEKQKCVCSEETSDRKVVRLTSDMVIKHFDDLSRLCYENVKFHSYMEHYSYQEANDKIKGLATYLKQNRAISYGYISDNIMVGFLWIYPYKYGTEERFYLGVIQVEDKFRRLGIGSQLYEMAMATVLDFGITHLYTHVDAWNVNSRNMHQKLGFIDEMYQVTKYMSKK